MLARGVSVNSSAVRAGLYVQNCTPQKSHFGTQGFFVSSAQEPPSDRRGDLKGCQAMEESGCQGDCGAERAQHLTKEIMSQQELVGFRPVATRR